MRPAQILVAVLNLALSACGQPPAILPLTPPVAPVVSPAASPVPSISRQTSSPDEQAAVDAALADAAAHLGVSRADLQVERVEPHEWSDSSLGCPRPGLLYSQILTPGYLIVIRGAGKQLEYHADTRGRVMLCEER
jgi:hypothetical protein